MAYCKHCERELEQRPEKAIGDGEVQMVWAARDDNWVCESTGNEHEPGGTLAFKFTHVNPFIEAGAGEAFFFTYRGKDYYYEQWATESASGGDLYDADTGESTHIDNRDAFEEALEEFQDIYYSFWKQYAVPGIERADKEAVAAWEARMKGAT